MAPKLLAIIVATLLTGAMLLAIRHERIVTAHRMAVTLANLRRFERTQAQLERQTAERLQLHQIRRLRDGLGAPLKPITVPHAFPSVAPAAPLRAATPRATTVGLRGPVLP